MKHQALKIDLNNLPPDERLALAIDVVEKAASQLSSGVTWNPDQEIPPNAEQVRSYEDRQCRRAEKLALLAAEISEGIWPLVKKGMLNDALTKTDAFPVLVSLSPTSSIYYRDVVRSLEEHGLGTKADIASGKKSRHRAGGDASSSAKFLHDIIRAWRGLPILGAMKRFANALPKHGTEDEQTAFRGLEKKAETLPSFTTKTAPFWWTEVGEPLLLLIAPEFAPRKRGRQPAGKGAANKKISAKRKAIKERFCDLAPGWGKSRNYPA